MKIITIVYIINATLLLLHEIEKQSNTGLILGIMLGVGGVIPAIVHKFAFKKADQFNLPISNAIILLNIFSGISLLMLSIS